MTKILVSACLLGQAVRYNGTDKPANSAFLIKLVTEGRAVPFCPEVASGLPVPRPPAEIVGDRVMTEDGSDVTAAFCDGARLAVETAKAHGCSCAIMTDGSPSCGSTRIYSGAFDGTRIPGKGMTVRALEAAGLRVFPESATDAAEDTVRR